MKECCAESVEGAEEKNGKRDVTDGSKKKKKVSGRRSKPCPSFFPSS